MPHIVPATRLTRATSSSAGSPSGSSRSLESADAIRAAKAQWWCVPETEEDYFYDKNGNVIAKVNISTGEALAFAYDNRNRLISALDVTSGLQMQGTYLYDALGKRIEKDVWTQTSGSTTTTRFAYDGDEIWADLTSANALQMRYLRGIVVLELLARVSSGGTAAWMLTDRMGSLRQVVDSTGAVIDTIAYDGYGNITSESNASNGGNYKPFGYRVDSETGWLRPDPSTGRYYDPGTGRWGQRDPIGFAAEQGNLYQYARSNPVNSTDPFGLRARSTTGSTSKALKDHLQTPSCRPAGEVSDSNGP